MPGGLSNSVPGYLVFGAVKLTGYSLAGWFLNRRYSNPRPHFVVVGIARILIGMALGALFTLLVMPLVLAGGLGIALLGIIPVRMIEWWILIWCFYDRSLQTQRKDWRYACLGTAWSFVLDLPALIGIVDTGGFWL